MGKLFEDNQYEQNRDESDKYFYNDNYEFDVERVEAEEQYHEQSCKEEVNRTTTFKFTTTGTDTMFKTKKIKLTHHQQVQRSKVLVGEGQQTKNITVSICSAVYESVLDNLKKKDKQIFKQNFKEIRESTTSNIASSISHFNQMIGLVETTTSRQNPQFFKEKLPEILKQVVSSGELYRRLVKGSTKKKINTKLVILKRLDKIVNSLVNLELLTEWK